MKEIISANNEHIQNSSILDQMNLNPQDYIVVSIHREENVDDENSFNNILNSLDAVSKSTSKKIIFSTHPRTRKKLDKLSKKINPNIKFIKPLGFHDYLYLQLNSYVTLSDSGTLAEETSLLKFPAVSIRTSTERPEAIDSGNLIIGSLDEKNILDSINISVNAKSKVEPLDYSNLDFSEKVIKIIQSYTPIVNKEVWKK